MAARETPANAPAERQPGASVPASAGPLILLMGPVLLAAGGVLPSRSPAAYPPPSPESPDVHRSAA